ncbi:MAG: HD domain-containing phosphohydrolase [Thermoanaerobaculia bacterium]
MQTLTLFHSKTFPIARYSDALQRESISARDVEELPSPGGDDDSSLRVVIADAAIAGDSMVRLDGATAVVGVGLSSQPSWIDDSEGYIALPQDPPPAVLLGAVKRSFRFLYQKQRADRLEQQLDVRTRELQEVAEVGAALATVRDHSVLLTLILTKAREISRADAGSLYLLDETADGTRVLRWKLAQNDSITVEGFEERVLAITRTSLAGYVAMTAETLVIDDAYHLPEGAEYEINRSFDEKNGYLTRSLLVFPMTNREGDIIGVLQLINRKRIGAPVPLTAATVPQNVIPFDVDVVKIMRALAGQAAVAVENALLYESIERLFDGFVTAAVTAIEQRDPTTSGHSFRVADLTVGLAKVIDRIDDGSYREIRFSPEQLRELRYASLLHDFGKVGVREQVLVKEKKLYPLQLDTIRARFDFAMKTVENETNQRKVDYLLKHGREGYESFCQHVDDEFEAEVTRLQRDFGFIAQSNEPTVLPDGEFEFLQKLAQAEYEDIRGQRRLLLDPEEARILSIRKGNLDAAERLEIESHVTHTFNFLQKIPWTKDLLNVPSIAFAHHEKLNGRGYPRRLGAGDIPIQSRMMTISDIYDALTASDRPYKRAIATERAIDILHMEAGDGMLDRSLLEVFVEAKIYEQAGVLRT